MAKTSSSKVPAGPSTRKQYLKKRATKVITKAATYAKQYRSNLQTICKIVDGLTITPLHIVKIRKIPFGHLFEKIANKQIDYQMCKKSDVDVATLIKTFHKRTGSFRIGGKSFNLIDSDISIIFGIQDVLEDLVMPKSAPKPSTKFIIRRFPSDARLTVPIITSKLREVANGTTPTDIEDFVRIICLILFVTMLLPTTGQSIGWGYLQLVDNYTEMVRYNWSAAIHKTLLDSLHKNSDTSHKVTRCVIALLYWFCERTNLIQPVEAEAFPRFLRWNLPSLNKEMSGDFHNKVSALQVNTCMPLEISEEERAIIEKNKNRASEEVHTTPPCETYETGQRELLATDDDVILLRDELSDEVDEEVDEKLDEEIDEEVIVSIQRLCDTILEEADRVSPSSKVQEETENIEEEHLTKVNDVLGIVIQKLQSDKWSMNLEIIHRGEVIEQLRHELVEAEQTIRSKVVESSTKDDVIQLLNYQLANLDDINVEHVQKIDDLTTQLVAVLETEKLKNENSASTSEGETGKMLDSDPNFAIYVTESGKDIKNKINKYAFSDRQDSIENHRKYGANLEVDIPIKYLCFFLENDAELEHIHTEYGAGHMLTGEVKKRLIEVLMDLVERHHRARAAVTDEMVDAFMAVRPLPRMFN